jgi:hypothetical protein
VERVLATANACVFDCPDCDAHYQVVKVEAGPETVDREITCVSCGAALVGREGNSVLKYFLVQFAKRNPPSKTAPVA